MILKKSIRKTAVLFICLILSCAGCSDNSEKSLKSNDIPVVSLSVWCNENCQTLISDMAKEFEKKYAGQASFKFSIGEESERTCRDTVLANPEYAADVYSFPNDQLSDLVNAGALLEISENTNQIIESVGGKESSAAQSAFYNGKLYACPQTAGNGYFLYYNSSYFSKEDVKKLDRILEICKKNNKKFAMDFTSGWYTYSFFKGAGFNLEIDDDTSANICDWNKSSGSVKGTDVAQSMLDIACNDAFSCCNEDQFKAGITDGTIIAGVNGAWNSSTVEKAWNQNYAATKLPVYSVNNKEVQMSSFIGYKFIGVNSHTEFPEWSVKFAEWITNEENQIKIFEQTGECPVNVKAASSPIVQKSPVVSALAQQSQFAYIQNIAEPFWDSSCLFGTTIAGRNPDGKDLQLLLDTMVEEATSKQ